MSDPTLSGEMVVRSKTLDVSVDWMYSAGVTYVIEANNPTLLPVSENVDISGDALDVYTLPSFDFANRLLQEVGMSSVRTEVLGRLQFKPAYDSSSSTTDFGDLYELRHQLLALAHENVEQAESEIETGFKSEYESLMENYRSVYSESSTNLFYLWGAAKIIDDTSLSNSARIVKGGDLPTYLDGLGEYAGSESGITAFETVFISQDESAGNDVLGMLDISDYYASKFTETKLVGQLWSDLKSVILYFTPDFLDSGTQPYSSKYGDTAWEDAASEAAGMLPKSYEFESFASNTTYTSIRDLGTDKVGGALSQTHYDSLFWSMGLTGNRGGYPWIRYLALSLSRELACSAMADTISSDFGTSDHTVLDFSIGKFGESEDGASTIFDLGSQPGGSIGDYLHATGSLSDGTAINILPFETRKLKYDGTSYYGSHEMVSQIVQDEGVFDTSAYAGWVTDYTDRAKNTCEYIANMLGLAQYSTDCGIPDHRGGLTLNSSNIFYFKEDSLMPISPARVFKLAFEVAKKISERLENDVVMAALPFIARMNSDTQYLTAKAINMIAWNSTIPSSATGADGNEYTVKAREAYEAASDLYQAIKTQIEDNAHREDQDHYQWILADDDPYFSDEATGGDGWMDELFIHEDKQVRGGQFAVFTTSRERYGPFSSMDLFDSLADVGYFDAFQQLFTNAWQAHVNQGGASASSVEAVFDASSLASSGQAYSVQYSATAGTGWIFDRIGSEDGDTAPDPTQEEAGELSIEQTVDYANVTSLFNYSFSGARTKFRKVSIEYLSAMWWELIAAIVRQNSDFTFGIELTPENSIYIYSSHHDVDDNWEMEYHEKGVSDYSGMLSDLGGFGSTSGGGDDDGNCFVAGTQITMGDGSKKNIEDITVGSVVLTYNLSTSEFQPSRVISTFTPVHSDIVEFTFSNGSVTRHTYDHPYYVVGKGWSSYTPDLTVSRYSRANPDLVSVSAVAVGDVFITEHGSSTELVEVTAVESAPITTYNINVDTNSNYFADGILVHNKSTGGGTGGGFLGWQNLPKTYEDLDDLMDDPAYYEDEEGNNDNDNGGDGSTGGSDLSGGRGTPPYH